MLGLTHKRAKELFDYAPETGVLVWLIRTSNCVSTGDIINKNPAQGYERVTVDGIRYLAHRVIWLWVYGYFPNEIDHINGDRTDNRLCNLRDVSHRINGKNQRKPTHNTSGRVGVSWHKENKKWRADIKVNGRTVYIGTYEEFDEAVKNREKAEIEYGYHPNHGR